MSLGREIGTKSIQIRYWAFISYSQHDVLWAKKLHRFLETYPIPRKLVGTFVAGRKVPPRLLPIFRDRDELASSSDLAGGLKGALEASDALIVICSPNAASSLWVNEEVRTYKGMGRSQQVFPFLIEAEPSDWE